MSYGIHWLYCDVSIEIKCDKSGGKKNKHFNFVSRNRNNNTPPLSHTSTKALGPFFEIHIIVLEFE